MEDSIIDYSNPALYHVAFRAKRRCERCGKCITPGCPCGSKGPCTSHDLSADEIAEAVGKFHNDNKFMKPHVAVYVDAIRRAGFDITRKKRNGA